MKAAEQERVLADLGHRIREKRQAAGLTLKELAERSQVSERFLGGMENGHANVSVIRLSEVAEALGTHAAELLGAKHSAAANEARPRVIITLIGLRGAGKSTVGARAAARLGVPFVELDQMIVERAGMSAGEIFDLHGAAYYRKLERAELLSVLDGSSSAIVATAGSLVTDHATYDLVLEKTTVVWVKATARDHHDRVVAQGDLRPMRDRNDVMTELNAILRARRALYDRAQHTIDTSKLGIEKSTTQLSKIVRDEWRTLTSHRGDPR